jgi:hypothetical protein
VTLTTPSIPPVVFVATAAPIPNGSANPQYVRRSLKDVRAEIKKIEALRVLSAKRSSGSDSLTTGSETITVPDDEECECVEVFDNNYLPG